MSPDERIEACTVLIENGTGGFERLIYAYFRRAAAYFSKGEFDLAIADYDQVLQHFPTNIGARTGRAHAYLSKDDFARAIPEFDEVIKLNPQSEVAYVDRGFAYYRNHDYDQAIIDYDEAIRLNPRDGYAYQVRGAAYVNKGDAERALEDCGRAIELNPKLGSAYACRGSAHLRKEDFDLAIADFSQAIQLNPPDASLYVSRGQAYRYSGAYEKALGDFNKAIEINGSADTYGYRANVYDAQGDSQRALADFSQAIRLDPQRPGPYFNRGVAYFRAGALTQALDDFARSSELSKRPYPPLWLGLVRIRMGQSSQLAESANKIDMSRWPAPIVRLFLGEMTFDEVLAAADDPNAIKRKGQICEANFYAGELALADGERSRAAELLQLSADGCPKNFVEWPTAVAELRAIETRQ